MDYVITHGSNRCFNTCVFGNPADAQAKISELEQARREGTPVQWKHYRGSEAEAPEFRSLFSDVSKDQARFRMGDDGKPILRPVSWTKVIGRADFGEWFEVECCYDRETPTTHVLVINGQRFELGTNPKGRFRFCKNVDLVLCVESERHFARVIPLSIHREDR